MLLTVFTLCLLSPPGVPLTLGPRVSLCASVSGCGSVSRSLRLHLSSDDLRSWLSFSLVPHHAPNLSGCSPTVGGSGPHGWLALEQFVGGEPQIAATWNKDFQHMLPLAACHHSSLPANITLQLKEGKLPDQCFSYSPVSGLHGDSHSSPCQKLELGRGSGLLGVGGGSWLPPSLAPLVLSEGCLESTPGSAFLVHSWAGRRPGVLLPLRVSLPAPGTHSGCLRPRRSE